jgi:hypothetical protein
MTAPVYGKDYLDNPPIRAVTAEEVRTYQAESLCCLPGCRLCRSRLFDRFGPRLLEHPGVSSTARAVIEAMLGVSRG